MAAGDRPATPDIRITEGLAPKAEVVNTGFTHPAAPAKSNLHEVAAALGSLSGELYTWYGQKKAKEEEDQKILGEAAFYKNNQLGYEEGVRQGVIPPQASPHFAQGYKRAQGSTAGFDLEAKIGAAYDSWDGKTSDDPNAFQDWFKGTMSNTIGTNDPAILRGLIPHIREVQNKYADKWRQDKSQDETYKAVTSYGALVSSTIDSFQRDGITSKEGPDYTKLGATVQAIRDNGYQIGLKRDQIDKQVVDAVTDGAVRNQNPEILKLLDMPSTAGAKLSDTPFGRDKKMQAENILEGLARRQLADLERDRTKKDKEEYNGALSAVTKTVSKNPDAEINEDMLRAVEKHDPNFRKDLVEMRNTFRKDGQREDPAAIAALTQDILAGRKEDAVWAAARGGLIKSGETFTKMVDLVHKTDEYRQKGGTAILETPEFKQILTHIEQVGKDPSIAADTIFGKAALTQAGREAMNDANIAALQWSATHPNASPLERMQFMGTLHETIAKSLTRGDGGAPAYTPAPALQQANPGNPVRAIGEGSQTPPPPAKPVTLQSLPPEQQAEINNRAKAFNMTADDYYAKYTAWKAQRQPAGPASAPAQQPASGGVPGQAAPQAPSPTGPQSSILDLGGGHTLDLTKLSLPPGTMDALRTTLQRAQAPRPPAPAAAPAAPVPMPKGAQGAELPSDGNPLKLASAFLGKNEQDNRGELAAFFESATGGRFDPVASPWCARFANSILRSMGKKGTGSDMARSLLRYGEGVDPETARPGDIMVFSRGTGGQGHVGFFKEWDENGNPVVVGGNQGGARQKGGGVTAAPQDRRRLLGVRRITPQTAMGPLPGEENGLENANVQLA